MPDNPSPSAQPDSAPAPVELNFDQPAAPNPRIKRRSLKGKSAGLKPATAPAAARELEKEAPPLSAESVAAPAARVSEIKPAPTPRDETPAKPAAAAPPRSKPTISLTSAPAASVTANRPSSPAPAAAASATHAAPKTAASTTPAASPHGTRPATLYYSSYPRKESSSSMKTNSSASPAASSTPSTSSASAATRPVTVAPAATAPRSNAAPIDYRANVERQTREQKSVGSILSYIVYALIFLFVVGAALAGYGGYIITKQLNNQSATLAQLDSKYDLKNQELTVRLAAANDTITQHQAALDRQQELINKQQEDINRLLAAINDNATATKAEAKARAQETAALRTRVRELENKNIPKY